MNPTLRRRMKQMTSHVFFRFDRAGIHLLPKHFYTPVADYSWLRSNKHLWTGRASLAGVHWDLNAQMAWLQRICEPYYSEVAGLDFYRQVCHRGPGFGPIESQVLHCFMRSMQPSRIVEIGSGVSTACMLHAAETNRQDGVAPPSITCVEPFPRKEFVRSGAIEHIEEVCQAVPLDVFMQLRAGDLLFIDSSHTLKVGSEVARIYLDIIPALAPGVFIHAHDITLPYLYTRTTLDDYFDWHETTLLLALLTCNDRLEPLAALSALHYDRSAELQELLMDYVPQANDGGLRPSPDAAGHFPASMWLRTR